MNRILVVEDEPGIALALEDSMRLEGHDVEVISNGAAASQRAQDAIFDLILLDVMLISFRSRIVRHHTNRR